MDEALDIVCKELDKQRRAKRELIRTIRILKQSIIKEMEEEHEAQTQETCPHTVCQGHEWSSWCVACGKTWETSRPSYVTTGSDFFIGHEVKPLYVSRFLTGVETGPVSQADGHVDED